VVWKVPRSVGRYKAPIAAMLFLLFMVSMLYIGYLAETYLEMNMLNNADFGGIRNVFERTFYLEGELDEPTHISYAQIVLGGLTVRKTNLTVFNSILLVRGYSLLTILDGNVHIVRSYIIVVFGSRLQINTWNSHLTIKYSNVIVEGVLSLRGNGYVSINGCLVDGDEGALDVEGLREFELFNSSVDISYGISIRICRSVDISTANISSKLLIEDSAELILKQCNISSRLAIKNISTSLTITNNLFCRPFIVGGIDAENTQIIFVENYVRSKPVILITEGRRVETNNYGEVIILGDGIEVCAKNTYALLICDSENIHISNSTIGDAYSAIYILNSNNIQIENTSIFSYWGGGLVVESSSKVTIENSRLGLQNPADMCIIGSSEIVLRNFTALGIGSLLVEHSTNISTYGAVFNLKSHILFNSSKNITLEEVVFNGFAKNPLEDIIQIHNSTEIILNSCIINNMVFRVDTPPKHSLRLSITNTTVDSKEVLVVGNKENLSIEANATHVIVFNSNNISIDSSKIQTVVLANTTGIKIAGLDSVRYLSASDIGSLILSNIRSRNLIALISNIDSLLMEYSSLNYSQILIDSAKEVCLKNSHFGVGAKVRVVADTLNLSRAVFRFGNISLETKYLSMFNTTINHTVFLLKKHGEEIFVMGYNNSIDGYPIEFVVKSKDINIENRVVGGLLIFDSSEINIRNISAETLIIYSSSRILIESTSIKSTSTWCIFIAKSHDISIENSYIEGPMKIEDSGNMEIENIVVNISIRNPAKGDAVTILSSENIKVTNSYIFNKFASTISALSSKNLSVKNNTLVGYSYVIDMRRCWDIIIVNNTLRIVPHKDSLVYAISLYQVANITIDRNMVYRSFSAICLRIACILEISNNEAYGFRIISLYRAILGLVRCNLLAGGYHLEILDSAYIWLLENTLVERWWYAVRPEIYIEGSRSIIAERNILKHGIMFVPVRVYRSNNVFLIRNKAPMMLKYTAEESSNVYVVGNFLGLVNLETFLICLLSIYSIVGIIIMVVVEVKKDHTDHR